MGRKSTKNVKKLSLKDRVSSLFRFRYRHFLDLPNYLKSGETLPSTFFETKTATPTRLQLIQRQIYIYPPIPWKCLRLCIFRRISRKYCSVSVAMRTSCRVLSWVLHSRSRILSLVTNFRFIPQGFMGLSVNCNPLSIRWFVIVCVGHCVTSM